jgi:hypothetical protein
MAHLLKAATLRLASAFSLKKALGAFLSIPSRRAAMTILSTSLLEGERLICSLKLNPSVFEGLIRLFVLLAFICI